MEALLCVQKHTLQPVTGQLLFKVTHYLLLLPTYN